MVQGMTDRQDLLARIQRVEEAYRPYQLEVDGAPIWPLLRMTLGGRMLSDEVAPAVTPHSGKTNGRLAMFFKAIIGSMDLLDSRNDRPLLFLNSRIYQANTPDGMVDKFAHPLMEAATTGGLKSVLVVKDELPEKPFKAIAGMSVLHVQAPFRMAAFLHWKKRPTPVAEMTGAQDLITGIERNFPPATIYKLDRAVHNFRMYLSWYGRLLRRIRPAHVFVTCWYSADNMAIAHLCSRMGIPCTDLQHGVQGPSHLAYGAWHGLPDIGCSSIPSSFWCWDEASAANIRSWAPQGIHIPYVGGSPWLEGYPNRAVNAIPVTPDRILFSMQPLTAPFPLGLGSAIKASPSSLRWVFRLHPSDQLQDHHIMQWAASKGVSDRIEVEDPRQTSITVSLNRALLHVTCFSSVIREAAMTGVHSVALDPNALNLYPDLVSLGMLTYTKDPAELAETFVQWGRTTREEVQRRPLWTRLQEIMAMDHCRP